MYYTVNVDIAVEFNQAAFTHGVSEKDIRNAIVNALYDDVWDEADDKHLLLGFDCKGNLLEVMYNIIDEQTVNVFHAMKCQRIYYHLLHL